MKWLLILSVVFNAFAVYSVTEVNMYNNKLLNAYFDLIDKKCKNSLDK